MKERHRLVVLSAVVLVSSSPSFAGLSQAAQVEPGQLDTSFDGDGRVVTAFDLATGEGLEPARAMDLVLPLDGLIVAVGTHLDPEGSPTSENHFGVAAYNADGSVAWLRSPDFRPHNQPEGELCTNTCIADYQGAAAALAENGDLIVAGQGSGPFPQCGPSSPSGQCDTFAFARFGSDGNLLSGPGADTHETYFPGPCEVWPEDVAVQPDGKIVIAGETPGCGDDDHIVLVRFTPSGALDSSFGDAGVIRMDLGAFEYARGLAIGQDGSIFVAGSFALNRNLPAAPDLTLLKFTPGGELDTSFAADGYATVDLGFDDQGWDVALQPDGRIVVAGLSEAHVGSSAGREYVVVRFLPTGELDDSFGSGGITLASTPNGAYPNEAHALALQGNGKIVVAGLGSSETGVPGFGLARFHPEGGIDEAFGDNGHVLTFFEGYRVSASTVPGVGSGVEGLAIQPDGKIVAAGSVDPEDTAAFDFNFALSRYGGDQVDGAEEPVARFEWSMAERLTDSDGDGIIDYLPMELSSISPSSWRVDFNACNSSSSGSIIAYEWTIDFADPIVTLTCDGFFHFFGSLGQHQVSLRVIDDAGSEDAVTELIDLRDWLILSLGDSFASGEGNPDVEGDYVRVRVLPTWPFVVPRPAQEEVWKDRDCHRSSFAGPTLAAVDIEEQDPHSSVTFVHLACSGATINEGMLTSYDGAEDDGQEVPAQVLILEEVLGVEEGEIGGRPIDAVLLSVGGNDIGFSRIIKQCLLSRCGSDVDTREVNRKLARLASDEIGQGSIKELFWCLTPTHAPGSGCTVTLDGEGLGIDPSRIFVTAYLDLTTREVEVGDQAPEIRDCEYLTIPGKSFGMSESEFRWARDSVLQPLNDTLQSRWESLGVNFLSAIESLGTGHGICESEDRRWVRQIHESADIQGFDEGTPKGAFHPNRVGHRLAYGNPIWSALTSSGIGV